MIEISNVTKHYGRSIAVEGLNLRIEAGDAFGFIGPNGAGKTTTIKMLATLIEPSEGDVTIGGYSIIEDPEAVRGVLGYMPDHFGVYAGMRVWEYLEFFAAAYRRKKSERLRLVDDVLELTDMAPRRNDFVEHLSTGLLQRVCLAKTLIHDPKVLVLDEPASGLDPRARVEFRELMKALTRMGKTLFVSSHILPELADFCNKIGIIESGRLLEFGAVDEVVGRAQAARVINVRVQSEVERARELLASLPLLSNLRTDGNPLLLQADFSGSVDDMADVLERLLAEKIRVTGMWEEKTDLEDVFMRITRGGTEARISGEGGPEWTEGDG